MWYAKAQNYVLYEVHCKPVLFNEYKLDPKLDLVLAQETCTNRVGTMYLKLDMIMFVCNLHVQELFKITFY